MGPGENAGAVTVGDGWVCAFKVESHNHPSAVEPFQGAATGVGGILRDIFAIGARPIAVLDSLRFGEPSSPRSRYLLDHAVGGIGHYGNSIGVPTIGGEVYFEGPYEQNCLVNAMALGLARADGLIRSAATGVGNALILFGASTGRDGIGGASVLASAELGDEDASKRPTVQVGDPFAEKKLLECSLELLDRGLLVALQDLGAAGLSSSSAEMASKGEVGLDIDVALVPLREAGMEPWEIMISESQERMLCVCDARARRRGARGLREVGGPRRRHRVGDLGARAARASTAARSSARCPSRRWWTTARCTTWSPAPPSAPLYPAPARDARRDVSDPRARCSRCWRRRTSPRGCRCSAVRLHRAVAHGAPARAGRRRGAGAAGGGGAIAVSIDGSGRRVACDPYTGTVEAVLECSANLACVGAEPLGPDELPELRQPREAAHRVAADRVDPRAGRRVPRPWTCRSWAATCRSTTRAAAGRSTRRRSSAWSASCPSPERAGPLGLRCAPATRSASPGRSARASPARSSRSCAARSCRRACRRSTSPRCARRRRRSATPCARATLSAPTTSPRAASSWRSRSRAWRAGVGCDARSRRCATISSGSSSASRRAAGFVVSGSEDALRRLGERVDLDIFGTVGGDALDVTSGDERIVATLDELRAAHAALAPLFP